MKIRRIIAFLTAFTAVFSTDTISKIAQLVNQEAKMFKKSLRIEYMYAGANAPAFFAYLIIIKDVKHSHHIRNN